MKRLLVLILTTICLLTTACESPQTIPLPQELDTPQYTVSSTPDTDFEVIEEEEIHTAQDSVKIINEKETAIIPEPNPIEIEDDTSEETNDFDLETVWKEDNTVTYNAYTMPEKAVLEDGTLGALSIPVINLTVNAYESKDGADMLTVMDKGVAHFKSTSSWDGNIGLSAHNAVETGEADFFKNLYTLKKGDSIYYTTALGEREYEIDTIKVIVDTDWSYLNRTDENKITLITCVSGQPSNRLMVQATQK